MESCLKLSENCIRKSIADSDGIVQIPTTTDSSSAEQDTNDDEDMSKLWCYCNEPSFPVNRRDPRLAFPH